MIKAEALILFPVGVRFHLPPLYEHIWVTDIKL